MDFIFASKIAKEHILVLEDLIRQFVDTFSELYPTVQPINKFHHMVHFPDIIRVHGPPVIYWCMRYEGYLNLVKQYAKSANNFVNFAKSAACHLQSIFFVQTCWTLIVFKRKNLLQVRRQPAHLQILFLAVT